MKQINTKFVTGKELEELVVAIPFRPVKLDICRIVIKGETGYEVYILQQLNNKTERYKVLDYFEILYEIE